MNNKIGIECYANIEGKQLSTISVNDRLTKLLGTVTTGFDDGECICPELRRTDAIWFMPISLYLSDDIKHWRDTEDTTNAIESKICQPIITVCDGKIVWKFKSKEYRVGYKFIWGVY